MTRSHFIRYYLSTPIRTRVCYNQRPSYLATEHHKPHLLLMGSHDDSNCPQTYYNAMFHPATLANDLTNASATSQVKGASTFRCPPAE